MAQVRVGLKRELEARFEYGYTETRPDETMAELSEFAGILAEAVGILATNRMIHKDSVRNLKNILKTLNTAQTELQEQSIQTNQRLSGESS